ncbi:unnamed protein product [Owenia fusiformis]|uniref:Uncharacterized protein n=1 Tax=Owenia fusiformis TaxID=6347 RepID=A0A8J1TY55_OWEFU|nr:unnamed protein product [Owenia fusiformis]
MVDINIRIKMGIFGATSVVILPEFINKLPILNKEELILNAAAQRKVIMSKSANHIILQGSWTDMQSLHIFLEQYVGVMTSQFDSDPSIISTQRDDVERLNAIADACPYQDMDTDVNSICYGEPAKLKSNHDIDTSDMKPCIENMKEHNYADTGSDNTIIDEAETERTNTDSIQKYKIIVYDDDNYIDTAEVKPCNLNIGEPEKINLNVETDTAYLCNDNLTKDAENKESEGTLTDDTIVTTTDRDPEYKPSKRTKTLRQFHKKTSNMTLRKNRKSRSNYKRKPKKIHKCDKCDYHSLDPQGLRHHTARMHCDERNQKCDQCDKAFAVKHDLQRHVRQSHTDIKNMCIYCSKTFKLQRSLKHHLKTHEVGYIPEKHYCEICCKTFSTKFTLVNHVKAEHEGKREMHQCDQCDKLFTQKGHVRLHIKAVHNLIKDYKCDVCGKVFAYYSSLQKHKVLHAEIRSSCVCSICGKTLSGHDSLVHHMKIHQPGKFVCSHEGCGKRFVQSQALKRHTRTHTGERPFLCQLCGKGFNDNSILRRHMIGFHNRSKTSWNDSEQGSQVPARNARIKRISEIEAEKNSEKYTESDTKAVTLTTGDASKEDISLYHSAPGLHLLSQATEAAHPLLHNTDGSKSKNLLEVEQKDPLSQQQETNISLGPPNSAAGQSSAQGVLLDGIGTPWGVDLQKEMNMVVHPIQNYNVDGNNKQDSTPNEKNQDEKSL